jgi:hypothetical protein
MTAVTIERPEAAAPRQGKRPGLTAAVRVEFAKLTAQWPLRAVLGLCVLAPIAFAVFAKSQWPSGPPTRCSAAGQAPPGSRLH